MSRSKRAAQGNASPAPIQREKPIGGSSKKAQTAALLAMSLLCYAIVALAMRWGLGRGFAALFEVWNLNMQNARRAPAWARLLYVWQGSVVSLAVSAAILALGRWLRRLWGSAGSARFAWRGSGGAALIGLAGAILVAALCLIPDSMRLYWPLTAPKLSLAALWLCAISFAAVTAQASFAMRVMYDGVLPRWGRGWAAAVASLTLFLSNGGWRGGPVGALNAVLMGLMCAVAYDGFGLWTTVGFMWSWSTAVNVLFGFGAGETAVYRLYSVSEALLTGGDAGFDCGLWTTLLLTAGTAWLFWRVYMKQDMVCAGRGDA